MGLCSIAFTKETLSNYNEALTKEWLVTNGLGGYASSTILGINTRKYHGLLIAAMHPPRDRTVCLSKLDEDVIVASEIYRLGTNEFADTIYPQGYLYLDSFSIAPFPAWTYQAGPITLEKTVFVPKSKNVVSIIYKTINNGNQDANVRLYPILTCRYFHNIIDRSQKPLQFTQKSSAQTSETYFQDPLATILCKSTDGEFRDNSNWVNGLTYRAEAQRGEASREDLFQPGYFEIPLPAGEKREFAVNVAADPDIQGARHALDFVGNTVEDVRASLTKHMDRIENSLASFHRLRPAVSIADWLNWILYAADSFVVKGSTGAEAVIAGYHWFESWGRDTFVSVPGLLLVFGRFSEAKNILQTYNGSLRNGLIPNYISDASGEPAYNTVDGTLWYINAAHQYLKYTGDRSFVRADLWRNMQAIIESHRKGTSFGIRLDGDSLLSHGPGLTWMDAEINQIAVTPRAGKAVEIQALWYNALRSMQSVAVNFGDFDTAVKYGEMADKTRTSFNQKFWNPSLSCLFDVLESSGADASIRPNQLLTISLDYPILYADRWQRVVDVVNRELVTPHGLRTLSPSDPKFIGKYYGDHVSRDRAYHNGTIWPWLLGPFVTAYLKAEGHEQPARERVMQKLVEPFFVESTRAGGLGTISEICDADPPQAARGCISQAWSIAEPFRAYVEDVLMVKPSVRL